MSARRLVQTLPCYGWLASAGLAAQAGGWMGPQPPCDISPGHFRINSAVVNLRTAVEKPTQRERMLSQTLDVLTRAITGDKQDQNPAAWYYLGRYYVEMADAAGADSAFDRAESLARQCAADIRTYREQLWTHAFNDGLRTWQEGKEDSAVVLLRRARGLLPDNPKPLFGLAGLYASRDQTDSAAAYYRQGIDAAGGDSVYERERRDAFRQLGRLELRRAQGSPALEQMRRARFSRDSLERAIASDSGVLSRMEASAVSRRRRGATLAPADQRLFSRDSAARAQGLARGREARGTLARRMAGDSAALSTAYDAAIVAYREYLAAYPDALEAAINLAALYGQTGRPAEAAAVFDRVLAGAATLKADELFEAGRRLSAGNLLVAAARAYALGLEKAPHHRDALFELASVYIQQRDSARAVSLAQRLVAVDPLNRAGLRLVGQAWRLAGRPDSALKYLARADSTLVVDIMVTSFIAEDNGATLTALASNVTSTGSQPLRLVFEFLNTAGGVATTHTAEVPALAPGASSQVEARVAGQGIVAWRYRL